jgi:hypothetical protein
MTHRERGIVNKSRTNERRGEKDPNMPVRKRAEKELSRRIRIEIKFKQNK